MPHFNALAAARQDMPLLFIQNRLTDAGVKATLESPTKLVADTNGFYERFGSNAAPHVGFDVTDYGDGHVKIVVRCPIEMGGKIEEYTGDTLEKGIGRIVEIFGPESDEDDEDEES